MKHVVRRIREYNCSNMELALTATLNILNKGSNVTVYIIISRGVCAWIAHLLWKIKPTLLVKGSMA
mgnify:CR=1 FL=1